MPQTLSAYGFDREPVVRFVPLPLRIHVAVCAVVAPHSSPFPDERRYSLFIKGLLQRAIRAGWTTDVHPAVQNGPVKTTSYRIGDPILLRATERYPLPKGLRQNQEAVVVWFLPGRRLVRAGDRYFEVAMANVHAGLGSVVGDEREGTC